MINALPQFSTLEVEKIPALISTILEANQSALAARLKQGAPYTWNNFVSLFEELNESLSQAWSPVQHLYAVMSTPDLRQAYHQCLPKLADYATALGQNLELYQAYQALQASSEFAEFDSAQQKVISNALRDFKLAGVALSDTARQRYQVIQQELSQLQTKFEENSLDATEAWQYQITELALLDGLPTHAKDHAQAKALAKNLSGYLLTLDQPSYLTIMQYADNRALREKIYHAYQVRASELSDNGHFDNLPLIHKILSLSAEKAHLLGFAHYAEYALVTKMAGNVAQVSEFLYSLAAAARPFAKVEVAELKKFALQQSGNALQSWDIAYYSEKLRFAKYNIDAEALRSYFPVNGVLDGMFTIIGRLYGMQVTEIASFDRWYESVQLFQISDQNNVVRGHFYTDLYARNGKRSGAWMDAYCGRFKRTAGLQTPIAYLTCNFSAATDAAPALLTHDEVTTLFHEFGHCLQHLLTQIDYPAVAGISGVAWDAVELPSQFFENWCWSAETLPLISRHYQSGEPLPHAMLTQLLAAKNFQAGMQTLRQVELALFDMRLYTEFEASQTRQVETILQSVRDEISVFQPPAFTRFPNSFAHIFAGGYAAGYYGYKWAEVLSADAFERFLQQGILNPQVGQEFLHTILESGGSRDAMDLFVQFRGRQPQVGALLRQEGMESG